jgi:predicted nucleic-acid-binding Zn-ribbon protein
MTINTLECSKCGGRKVVPNVAIKTETNTVKAEVLEAPKSWLYNKPLRKNVVGNVCTDCGYIDMYISKEDARELWEVYQKNK